MLSCNPDSSLKVLPSLLFIKVFLIVVGLQVWLTEMCLIYASTFTCEVCQELNGGPQKKEALASLPLSLHH